jgi:hypothetical protein
MVLLEKILGYSGSNPEIFKYLNLDNLGRGKRNLLMK